MERTKPISEARERILATADRLFYAEGLRAVGIDRIIAEAGVAKMTLYGHFRSKDDLILAVLRRREAQVAESFRSGLERHGLEGLDRVDAFFATLREWFESPDFRGCAFINASVELADPDHPASAFVREQKLRFRAFLAGLIAEATGPADSALATAVSLLVEGAIVTAVIHRSSDPADVARATTRRLLAGAKVV